LDWLEQAWAVFRKDMRVETRTRVNLNATVFFACIVLLIFGFALGPSPERLRPSAGGLLWLAVVFTGILAFSRVYQLEEENDALEGLLLMARHHSAIYMGKFLFAVFAMTLVELILIPLMGILYNLDLWAAIPSLLLIGIFGTLGFAAVGTLYGALTVSFRAREVLLPLLLLPIVVPVLLASVTASSGLLEGQPVLQPWMLVLGVFDVAYISAGLLLFDHVVAT
jgi:heme exporter protein B